MSITNVKKHTRCREVKNLFIQGTRQWNEGKIREIFYPHDADEIIKPEPMKHDEDGHARHYESTGVFNVKSAYKLAFNIQRATHFNSGNSGIGDDYVRIYNCIVYCIGIWLYMCNPCICVRVLYGTNSALKPLYIDQYKAPQCVVSIILRNIWNLIWRCNVPN
jgi:hypothetical protein